MRGAYAVSWTYLIGDVGLEGYKAFVRGGSTGSTTTTSKGKQEGNTGGAGDNATTDVVKKMAEGVSNPLPKSYSAAVQDYRAVMLERAVFQSLASMALPALTIHSVVKYSGRTMKGLSSVFLRTWGPVGVCPS